MALNHTRVMFYFLLLTMLVFIFSINNSIAEPSYTFDLSTNQSTVNPGDPIIINLELTGKGNFNAILTLSSDQDNLIPSSAFVKVYRLASGMQILDNETISESTEYGAILRLPINATNDDTVLRYIHVQIVLDTNSKFTSVGEHIITASLIGFDSNDNFIFEGSKTYKVNTCWEQYPFASATISSIVGLFLGIIIGRFSERKLRDEPDY